MTITQWIDFCGSIDGGGRPEAVARAQWAQMEADEKVLRDDLGWENGIPGAKRLSCPMADMDIANSETGTSHGTDATSARINMDMLKRNTHTYTTK